MNTHYRPILNVSVLSRTRIRNPDTEPILIDDIYAQMSYSRCSGWCWWRRGEWLSGVHSCTALTPEDEPRWSASQGPPARTNPQIGGGIGAGCRLKTSGTCISAASADGNAVCSGAARRDVGVSGESSRGAARQRRESRGGRAGAGRQALPGRALLRLQPERAVQTVQRQPVRVLQQVQKGVWTQGQIGNRLHLVRPGPETLAGLFAGDAVACLTFQRQT